MALLKESTMTTSLIRIIATISNLVKTFEVNRFGAVTLLFLAFFGVTSFALYVALTLRT